MMLLGIAALGAIITVIAILRTGEYVYGGTLLLMFVASAALSSYAIWKRG